MQVYPTFGRVLFAGRHYGGYRHPFAPRSVEEALQPTRLGTWRLRIELLKQVRQGLSCEDANEMAVGVGAILPAGADAPATLHPHAFGFIWLYIALLHIGCWLWTVGPCLCIAEVSMTQRVSGVALLLAHQSRQRGLDVWKVCRRRLGVEHGWTRDSGEPEPDPGWGPTVNAFVALALFALSVLAPPIATAGIVPAAFTNFYMDASGSDLNAGSVIASAASVTSTNGDWGNAAANRFTAASGTPFSGVNVGDLASIFLDAATVTTYVAKVTAVNGGGASIDLDGTIKYGTAPATGATGRTCKIGGSWASEIVLAATGLATTTIPQSTKINFNNALSLAASRTISMSGPTTAPLWFSGYNTTPGDLDNDTTNGLAKPVWTVGSTLALTTSGDYHIWSSLSLTGNVSNRVWNFTGRHGQVSRCRIANISSNAAAYAINLQGTGGASSHISYSFCTAPTTATNTGICNLTGDIHVVGTAVDLGGGGELRDQQQRH